MVIITTQGRGYLYLSWSIGIDTWSRQNGLSWLLETESKG
jgi:hypothetical protein